jgi:hypothetical protein
MAFGEIAKQFALEALRTPDPPPVPDAKPAAPGPSENVGAIILGQIQAMQKALKEDQELVVQCNAGGETIRVLEIFLPSWQVAVLTGIDTAKNVTRIIAPIESLQLVCKPMRAAAKPVRIVFIAPKPKSESEAVKSK